MAWASLWECRAAQSRQARAEEAQGASWGTAKPGTLTVLQHRRGIGERGPARQVEDATALGEDEDAVTVM